MQLASVPKLLTCSARHSRRMERTNLSAYAFRFGLLAGRRRGFTPESLNSPRTASVNSGSRSWMRYRLNPRRIQSISRRRADFRPMGWRMNK